MTTLRQAITARIEGLTAQVVQIQNKSSAAIAPLQLQIQTEQQKLVLFSPWLDQEVTDAQAKLSSLLDSYKA